MKHQKKTNPNKRSWGKFGRNEWAILGTSNEEINSLPAVLIEFLSANWEIAYLGDDFEASEFHGTHLIQEKEEVGDYDFRRLFNEKDLVIVNGNRLFASRQIIVIDSEKEGPLNNRLDRLTQVDLLLFVDPEDPVPGFIKSHVPDWEQLPQLALNDREGIIAWINDQLTNAVPPIYGLLLAGGESRRMGEDKGLLKYHGKPQREWGYDLLATHTEKTFLSVRPDQEITSAIEMNLLPDSFLGLGPFGGILSAFRAHPNVAWLIAAVDLPFLDHPALEYLLQHRNPARVATAFKSPDRGFPDPLLAIWEPKAYLRLFQFLTQGVCSPRKVLSNSSIHLLKAPNPEWLINVNDPDEFQRIKNQLS